MCLFPKIIDNPKYKPNRKNGGNVPTATDKRVIAVPIGCGLCMECMRQKANEWRMRLLEDIKEHANGKFVTLTLSNQSFIDLAKEIDTGIKGYSLDNAVATLAVRRFLERYRKKHKRSIRHWLITELGHEGQENVHLHGILYMDNIEDLEKYWQYGYCWKGKQGLIKDPATGIMREGIINYVGAATATYITKYLTKVDLKHKYYKPVILCSAGIGRGYTKSYNFKKNKFKGEQTKETYTTSKGTQVAMPVYWRNKAYSEEEREILWIQKLDKQVRYVNKCKIDVSKGEEEYWSALKAAQQKSKELGYGDPKNWKAKRYEQQRRYLKLKERLKNTTKGV